jgi:hypothetical protein
VGGLGKIKMPKKPKKEMRRSISLAEKNSCLIGKPLFSYTPSSCCLSSLFSIALSIILF